MSKQLGFIKKYLFKLYFVLPPALQRIAVAVWNRFVKQSFLDSTDVLRVGLNLPICRHWNRSITVLMYAVWRSDPDLQKRFPLKDENGRSVFFQWFSENAGKEVGAPASLVSGAEERVTIDDIPQKASTPDPGDENPETMRSDELPGPGVNLVGFAAGELGMGEDVRMAAKALSTTSAVFCVVNYQHEIRSRQKDLSARQFFRKDNPYRCNILYMHADFLPWALSRLGPSFISNRYNIVYCPWELSASPPLWKYVFDLVDEVWVHSDFIRRSFIEVTEKPVRVMTPCVSLDPGRYRRYSRKDFGLPEDRYLFLHTFDFGSTMYRKNPAACVSAFQKAFPKGSEPCTLIIKTMNVEKNHPEWKKMLSASSEDARIKVFDKTVDRDRYLGLLWNCDSFVSLHRSEGFGRGMAEAMLMGKPVIVTNYSGNVDYTLPDNACTVDYRLISAEGFYAHSEKQVWADPDTDHAASYMKRLVYDAEYGEKIGRKAKAFIETSHNPCRVGDLYMERLKDLGLLEVTLRPFGEKDS